MYDIVFIGPQNNEWQRLKSRFVTAKHANTFEEARKKVFTKMFWAVWSNIQVLDNFNFSYKADNYSLDVIHVFKNGEHFDGVSLIPKKISISSKEIEYRYFRNKKEVDILASIPLPYDIVFISYNESNADENYNRLLERFPRVKRVHGVKGIHQAHIEAAKLCNSDMFWVVDADAEVVEEFSFDYQVPNHQLDNVHVWRSKNPINGLEYGYGGIKLFPRRMTINMDTSKADMTTSISNKFLVMDDISNLTAFNTDPFETWKSAFRECTKLASKIIDRQKNEETENRLHIWQTVGKDRPYGEFALRGAQAGSAYGKASRGDIEALKKINDFDWLHEQFSNNTLG